MRLILSLIALVAVALLAGCSTASALGDAWTWDPTRMQAEPTHLVLSPDELSALTNRTADLQLQLNGIRSRIGSEADMRARQGLYEDLHRVGRQLSPLERQLMAAAPAR